MPDLNDHETRIIRLEHEGRRTAQSLAFAWFFVLLLILLAAVRLFTR